MTSSPRAYPPCTFSSTRGSPALHGPSDPAYRRLSLGTVSALLEIGLVRRIRQCVPGLHYYYLGYYLGECAKMAYKARFAPSELLDPETLLWEELK